MPKKYSLAVHKLRAAAKRKKQEEKEERLLARWILFGKGRGQSKNLNRKDNDFLNEVRHKAYDRYMSDLTMGTKLRLNQSEKLRMTRSTPSRPMSFKTYCRIWYGSSKRNYIIHDVTRLMNMRMEVLRNGSADTQMPERGGRYMQELRREIGERERGNVDIPVRELPLHSSGEQGFNQGQEQLRQRRKKTPAGNRDAATVGTP